jgi:hypothetical protein
LGAAASEWTKRRLRGAPKFRGRKQRPRPEETALAAMSVADGFNLLAKQEPRLLPIADEVMRVAETGRLAGHDDSSIRTAALDIMLRIVATDPLVGPKASKHSRDAGLVATLTAAQVVWAHLASLAGVSRGEP